MLRIAWLALALGLFALLGGRGEPTPKEDLKTLEKLLDRGPLADVAPVLERLVKKGDADDLERLLPLGLKDERPAVGLLWLDALSQVTGQLHQEVVLDSARRTTREAPRLLLAQVLGRLANPKARDRLEDYLGDRSWRVRSAAAASLGRLGDPEAEKALRARLEDEHPRVRLAAARALERLGLDPGEAVKLDFSGWLPKPLLAERVAFVVEADAGMRRELLDETGQKTTRREAIAEKVCAALETLPRGARFQIHKFHLVALSSAKAAEPVNVTTRKAAREFLLGGSGESGRATWEALHRALADEDLDTIVLITDGLPKGSDIRDPDDIRRRVREAAFYRHLWLHVVQVAAETDTAKLSDDERVQAEQERAGTSAFLEGLARDTGGSLQVVRFQPPQAPAAGTAPKPEAERFKIEKDQDGHVTAKEWSRVTKAFQEATERQGEPREEDLDVVRAVAACDDRRSATLVVQGALWHEQPRLAWAAYEGLIQCQSDEVVDQILVSSGRTHDLEKSVIFARVLGHLPGARIVAHLRELLRDKRWAVVSAAIEAVARREIKEALPELERVFDRKHRRLSFEAAVAVSRLGGQPPDGIEHGTREGMFYPSLRGEVVAILFDASREMEQACLLEDGSEARRATIVKRGILDVLGRTPDGVKLQVIAYNSTLRKLGAGPQALGPALRQQAEKFFAFLDTDGQRDLYLALKQAFAIEDLDTVYIISSGLPRGGAEDDPVKVLARIQALNRDRHVRLHTMAVTVATGFDPQKPSAQQRHVEEEGRLAEFLQQVAECGGGSYYGITGIQAKAEAPAPHPPGDGGN